MHKEYTFYFCNPLNFLLNFYAMKKIFSILFVFLVLAALFCGFSIKKRLDATSKNPDTVLLEVPKGSSAAKVSQILQEKGVWDDALAFKIWCKINPPALKAGWFEIPAHQKLNEIIAIIESGKNAVRKVTIPEGRASWEIPAYLKKAFPDLDEDRWNRLVQDPKFTRSLGVEANSLEGYLLPETYPFPIDADEETILKQMVAANLKLRDELKEQPGESMWNTLGNWHRVLTLASVVEEETGKTDERPLISGVFHNRLRIGMPEQRQPVQHPQVQGTDARTDFEPGPQGHRGRPPPGRNQGALFCRKGQRIGRALLQQHARRPQQVQGHRRKEPRGISRLEQVVVTDTYKVIVGF